jgi:hypothetical protein
MAYGDGFTDNQIEVFGAERLIQTMDDPASADAMAALTTLVKETATDEFSGQAWAGYRLRNIDRHDGRNFTVLYDGEKPVFDPEDPEPDLLNYPRSGMWGSIEPIVDQRRIIWRPADGFPSRGLFSVREEIAVSPTECRVIRELSSLVIGEKWCAYKPATATEVEQTTRLLQESVVEDLEIRLARGPEQRKSLEQDIRDERIKGILKGAKYAALGAGVVIAGGSLLGAIGLDVSPQLLGSVGGEVMVGAAIAGYRKGNAWHF